MLTLDSRSDMEIHETVPDKGYCGIADIATERTDGFNITRFLLGN